MENRLNPGLAHTSELTVDRSNTAEQMGSGDMPVLATPAMAALMENAAMLAVSPHLDEGDTTVGSALSISHLLPSPIGATVSATATLERQDGRRLDFRVEARCGDALIGEGTHVRYIVSRDRFLAKLSK